ncbi:MAG: hypothetical protein KME54_03845 [Tolypothrix brevis GSE-NOS-MK-07-07A]|nr:hypothetical protein [Tolypothrix brevis GSE-NOS-MK-07-07A]
MRYFSKMRDTNINKTVETLHVTSLQSKIALIGEKRLMSLFSPIARMS